MAETGETQGPLQIAFESLKGTFTMLALLADLVAFFTLAIIVMTKIAPLVPYATIVLIILLLLTLLSVLIAFGRVVTHDQRAISSLEQEKKELCERLTKRPERRDLIEAQLKNRFKEVIGHAKNQDELVTSLKDDIFPFLVREFGFSRVALSTVDGSTDLHQLEFAYPDSKSKKWEHEHLFDEQARYILQRGHTTEIIPVSYGEDFTGYFLFIPPEHSEGEPPKQGRWFVFSFRVERAYADSQAEMDYLRQEIADELRGAFTFVRNLEAVRILSQDVRHSHLCAILYANPDGQVRVDRSCDCLPLSEVPRLQKILEQPDNKKHLASVLNWSSSDPPEPVIVPGGSYNLSLVPVLVGNRVHRVVCFVDEADGHILASDQTRWDSLFRLTNYLHTTASSDEITGLANKWYLERHLKTLSKYENSFFALFSIGVECGSVSEMLADQKAEILRKVAGILDSWVSSDLSRDSLLARHEGGVFMLLKDIASEQVARFQAEGIKSHIESGLEDEDQARGAIRIGVTVFRTPFGEPHDLLGEGLRSLKLAESAPGSIYTTEFPKPADTRAIEVQTVVGDPH